MSVRLYHNVFFQHYFLLIKFYTSLSSAFP